MSNKTKICTKCKQEKPVREFNKDTRSKIDGRRARCKCCENYYERERRKRFKKENPEIAKNQEFKYNIKNKYGLEVEEYNKLFEEQQGCCAICNKHQSELSHRLCVEHRHSDNKVRALVCKTCNHLIDIYETQFYGLEDNIIEYFEKNNG